MTDEFRLARQMNLVPCSTCARVPFAHGTASDWAAFVEHDPWRDAGTDLVVVSDGHVVATLRVLVRWIAGLDGSLKVYTAAGTSVRPCSIEDAGQADHDLSTWIRGGSATPYADRPVSCTWPPSGLTSSQAATTNPINANPGSAAPHVIPASHRITPAINTAPTSIHLRSEARLRERRRRATLGIFVDCTRGGAAARGPGGMACHPEEFMQESVARVIGLREPRSEAGS
jgi:hypothetical protein